VSTLKLAAMNMLVKMADQNTLEDLREQFVAIDKDKSGLINSKELKNVIKKQKNIFLLEDEEIDKIIDEVDFFGNDKINYTEFLVATMDTK
jgi:calcium-dependent protein kinase